MKWIKASRSTAFGACVEVAFIAGGVVVRDSKNPHVSPLWYTREEWAAFLDGAKNGEFDDLGA